MNLEEFREDVYREFGQSLERATTDSIRNFVDKMQALLYPPLRVGDHIHVGEEGTADFESIVLEFFANSLRMPSEEAVIGLWLFAVETWFSTMEDFYDLPPFSEEDEHLS